VVIDGKSAIEFVYDASGQKLKKKVTYANSAVRVTSYIGDYVYEQYTPPSGGGQGAVLLYVTHEEGRLKIITPKAKVTDNDYELNAGDFGRSWPGGKQGVFEYFVKDHVGSTRMVLTEEVQKEYYKASMEDSEAGVEEPLFGKVDLNGQVVFDNELK